MTTRIDIWTDYVCPFCFFATMGLQRLEREQDVEVHWRSYMLRPPGSPEMPPDVRAIVAGEHRRAIGMARDQHGIELNPGPIGIRTYNAHLATKWADAEGLGRAFHRAAMKAYWQDGLSLEDDDVLKEIAANVGLSAGDFAPAIRNTSFAEELDKDADQAAAFGIRGVPAMLLDENFLVPGVLPYESLKRVLTKATQL